jgi:hypothetical protein
VTAAAGEHATSQGHPSAAAVAEQVGTLAGGSGCSPAQQQLAWDLDSPDWDLDSPDWNSIHSEAPQPCSLAARGLAGGHDTGRAREGAREGTTDAHEGSVRAALAKVRAAAPEVQAPAPGGRCGRHR